MEAGPTVIEISKQCMSCWAVLFLFFYPAGESSRRRLFLPCVVSLEQSCVIFYHAEMVVICQRE